MSDAPVNRSRAAPHSRNGCLTCRRRKKKCDETRPVCTACFRIGLECSWPAQEIAPNRRRPRRRQTLAARSLPAELAAMVTVFPVSSPDLVRRLLHHFSDYGPMWLTSRTGKSRNAILFHLFPEAMNSPLVLHCVLMIAAEDLLKYDSAVNLQAATVEYYGRAVSGLQEALASEAQGDDLASDETLLAVALFCLHENYSSTARLIPHLNGAATLLRRRLHTTPPNLNLRRFLFEMFCYFFSITAFTHGSSLEFDNSSHIFDSPFLHDFLQVGTIMGTSQKAFPIIYGLCRYQSQRQSTISLDTPPQLDPYLLNSVAELQILRPPFQIHQGMTEGTISDGITFELYRLAYVIHTKNVIDPTLSIYDIHFQELVSSFVAYLIQLPPESPSDGFLCWPLVVVGLRAIDRAHQTAIATKLKSIYQRFRSEIFSRNLAFLRGWWREKDRMGVERQVVQYPAILV